MIKIGAKAILGVMMTGLLALAAWAGNAIIANKAEISALKSSRTSVKENIIEIKDDMKEIKQDIKDLLRRVK